MLYSVLCRFHIRSGIPSARHTNLTLWGNVYGKKLFLPDGIKNIASQIPLESELTAERFIKGCTILPLLKPFLNQGKCDELLDAMVNGNANTYNIVSFPLVFTQQRRYLVYCNQCVERDTETYGESYWHRVHQLPGVYVCPIHGIPTIESGVAVHELPREYCTLPSISGSLASYAPDITEKMLDFALDAAWLLQNGFNMQSFDYTDELYDKRLRIKGYRNHWGKTSNKRLAKDVATHYGREFLELLEAYNSGTCIWIKHMVQRGQSFRHPLHHLLLMRFLAGSAEAFFMEPHGELPGYLPFGAPPYPCRNHLCEYHLQDVIEQIELRRAHGTPYATFICPHCGLSYNRKGKVPKERHYSGHIRIVDYGWKWEAAVAELLAADESPYKIARKFHCDVRTILAFGIERGLLPPDRSIGRTAYIQQKVPKEKLGFSDKRILYRQRWLDAIAGNPAITRNELRLLECTASKWLHEHDPDWLEQNSPPSKNRSTKWAGSDDEYFEMVEDAVKQIRGSNGNPQRISISSIGRKTGIVKPHTRLMSDFMPKTKAFVESNVETLEQWQKRKIRWVVSQMRERGELMTVYKVRHAARIEDRERKLDEFILECIENSKNP
jgi:hypothetical protein